MMRKLTIDEKRRALPGLRLVIEGFEDRAMQAFKKNDDDGAKRLRGYVAELRRHVKTIEEELEGIPRTTRKPDPYAGERGGAHYEGHDLAAGGMDTIWSVGLTPQDAIGAFLIARCGTTLSVDRNGPRMNTLQDDNPSPYDWGYSFTDTEGTGFKAGGICVPGGVVLTWWK